MISPYQRFWRISSVTQWFLLLYRQNFWWMPETLLTSCTTNTTAEWPVVSQSTWATCNVASAQVHIFYSHSPCVSRWFCMGQCYPSHSSEVWTVEKGFRIQTSSQEAGTITGEPRGFCFFFLINMTVWRHCLKRHNLTARGEAKSIFLFKLK